MTDAPLGTTQACPECDTTEVRKRILGKATSTASGKRWKCNQCQAEFHEPVTRERESISGTPGLAGKLEDAEPGDLVTDGGEDVLGWTRGRYPHTNGQRVLHTESDCPALQQATQTRAVTDPDEADDLEDCDICAGESEATTEHDWSYQEALRDARDEQIRSDGGVPDPNEFQIPTVADLDAMRVAKGLSQRALSRRAGCEKSRFNDILRNDIDPHASTIRAFLTVLQDAEPRDHEEIERTGPKPEPSPNAEPEPDDFELLSAQLRHSPPDAVGEDPRPPERERDDGLRPDGGHDVDEHERRARQAAHSLVEWCDRADVEPEVVLEDVREGIPSGREPAHYCEICSTGFESVERLIEHDCEETGEDVLYLTKIGCNSCEQATTVSHRGPAVPLDQDPPLPDVDYCPKCGTEYPHDLGVYVWDVHEAEIYDPTTRGRSLSTDSEGRQEQYIGGDSA